MMDYKIHGRGKVTCGPGCGQDEPEFTIERDAALRHWELTRYTITHVPDGECHEYFWRALIPDSVWRDPRFQTWVDDRRSHDKERVAQEAARANH